MGGYTGNGLGLNLFPTRSYIVTPEKGDWQIVANEESKKLEYQRWNGTQWVTKVYHGASVESDEFILNTSAGGLTLTENGQRSFLVLPKLGDTGVVLGGHGHTELVYSQDFKLYRLSESITIFELPTDGSTIHVDAGGMYTYSGITSQVPIYVVTNTVTTKNGTSTYNFRLVLRDPQGRIIMETQTAEEYATDITPQPIGINSKVEFTFNTQRPWEPGVIPTIEIYSKEAIDLEAYVDDDDVIRYAVDIGFYEITEEGVKHVPTHDTNTSYSSHLSTVFNAGTFLVPNCNGVTEGLFNLNEWVSTDCNVMHTGYDFNALTVSAGTIISFSDLTERSIVNYHGTCTQPTVSGNNVVFSDSGIIEAFQFDNNEWIVLCAGAGNTAYNVDPRTDLNIDLGDGIISNATWSHDGTLGYAWNYGGTVSGGTIIPAVINKTKLVNGDPITHPAIYGDNDLDGTIVPYTRCFGEYEHISANHTITSGVDHVISTPTLIYEAPKGIQFLHTDDYTIHLPNGIMRYYMIKCSFTFNALLNAKLLDIRFELNDGSNTVIYAETVPVLKKLIDTDFVFSVPLRSNEDIHMDGFKVIINTDVDGTITYERIEIIEM